MIILIFVQQQTFLARFFIFHKIFALFRPWSFAENENGRYSCRARREFAVATRRARSFVI